MKIKSKKLLFISFFLFIFLILINIIGLFYIKNQYFPFVYIHYYTTPKGFNSAKLNYNLPLSQDFKSQVEKDLKNKIPVYEPKSDTIFKISQVLTYYVRTHLFHKSAVVHNVGEILKNNKETVAICSGYSKFLASIAQSLGFKARVIWLKGHTVSEIFFPDYGWVLVDTNGNLMFKIEDRFANLLEVVNYFQKVTPLRIVSKEIGGGNDPDFLSTGIYKIYRRNPLVVVIEGPRLFDFDIRTKSPAMIMKYIIGIEDIAKGIQYIGNHRKKVGNIKGLAILLIFTNLIFIIFIVLIFYKSKESKQFDKDKKKIVTNQKT